MRRRCRGAGQNRGVMAAYAALAGGVVVAATKDDAGTTAAAADTPATVGTIA